jgi:hypothetical protein
MSPQFRPQVLGQICDCLCITCAVPAIKPAVSD